MPKTVGGFTIHNSRLVIRYLFGSFLFKVKENVKERIHEIYLLDGVADEDIIAFQLHFGKQFQFYRYDPINGDEAIKELYIAKQKKQQED